MNYIKFINDIVETLNLEEARNDKIDELINKFNETVNDNPIESAIICVRGLYLQFIMQFLNSELTYQTPSEIKVHALFDIFLVRLSNRLEEMEIGEFASFGNDGLLHQPIETVIDTLTNLFYDISENEIKGDGQELSLAQINLLKSLSFTPQDINYEVLSLKFVQEKQYGAGSTNWLNDTQLAKFTTLWRANVINAIGKGLAETFSRLGISDIDLQTILQDSSALLKNVAFENMSLDQIRSYFDDYVDKMTEMLYSNSVAVRTKTEIGNQEKLTENQIDQIIDFEYQGRFKGITNIAEKKVKTNLIKQLREIQVEPQLLGDIRHQIRIRFENAFIRPGARVGLIAAQALGEQATQAGLRAFHHAGISSDSGFERIENVTSCSKNPKNTFTYIALKESMSFRDARIVASKIEYADLDQLCVMEVGRTSEAVNQDGILGGITVFEQEDWHRIFIAMMKIQKDDERGYVDNEWVIRMFFKSDALYQKRISMSMIAEIIEERFNDVRVIYSNIATGVMDLYITSDIPPGESNETLAQKAYYYHLSRIQELRKLPVQGTYGFSRALVENLNISNYITKILQRPNNSDIEANIGLNKIVVEFAVEDILLSGIPDEHIKNFLALKASIRVNDEQFRDNQDIFANGFIVNPNSIEVTEDHDFIVFTPRPADKSKGKKSLEYQILTEETIKLKDAVLDINELLINNRQNLVIKLDIDFLVKEHNVSPLKLEAYFEAQNQLARFAYANIIFNRAKFEITITSKNFTGQTVFDSFNRFLQAVGVTIDSDIGKEINNTDFTLFGVNSDKGFTEQLFLDFATPYGDILDYEILEDQQGYNVKFMLKPGTLQNVWDQLITTNGNDTLFTSEKRESLGHRYRILARGTGLKSLAKIRQIDISATISSNTWEIYYKFGIEAARAQIYAELKLNSGNAVSERHIAMLADVMTMIGNLAPLTIAGKRMIKSGVLATVAMQQSFDMFIQSAMAGATDPLRSSVAQTLLGDFERSEVGKGATFTANKDDTDSAINLLMSATVSTKVPKQKRATKIIKVGKSTSKDEELNKKKAAKDKLAQLFDTNKSKYSIKK